MSKQALASLEADGRLVLTVGKHELRWLAPDRLGQACVVEIVRQGCVYITTLAEWARRRGLGDDEEAARDEIGELCQSVEGQPRIAGIELVDALRKGGPGSPVYRLPLSPAQSLALFPPGVGPLGSSFGRKTVRLLVRSEDAGMFLWSAEDHDLIDTGDLSLFRGL